ncbi:MAG: hypothetical protein P0Y49_04865 [Candidatus Pedobacter colombiensis]|uniref:Uncharacterized protein n=1 Tax=Candidatus Pedobacter colombiensis TaxID=3121371 RepID=A0AAJ5W8A8_9SPHI|nr:hypothetical protein [Pedobacter sp.]WEK20468.1 MAG: hypothetical protein P0Y49_04865 [Pedobacter sp.]
MPELDHGQFMQVGYKSDFFISSKDEFLTLSEGDPLVIIKPEVNGLRFVNTALVEKAGKREVILPSKEEISKSRKNGNPPPKPSYNHYFKYVVEDQLRENNSVNDLEYSLESVDNFGNPATHFQRQYRKIPNDDYETIINGWIYATRTVFGKLINSIPRQNKLEFMLQSMDRFSTIDFKEVPILDGLDFLYEFIETRIISRGKLLVATSKLIKSKLNDLVDETEIGFINPETEVSNRLLPQAEIFEQLLELEKKVSLKAYLKESVAKNKKLEERFEKKFARKTWPIDLRI